MTRRVLSAFLFVLLVASIIFGQANGKLQIHFMDVGESDAAILISPEGETAYLMMARQPKPSHFFAVTLLAIHLTYRNI